MINFRFHLISLVAVFLALGVGVAMGASFVDRATVDSLRGRVDTLAENYRRRGDELDATKAQLKASDAQAGSLAGEGSEALTARLSGQPVVVIAADGVPGDVLDGTRTSLTAANAIPGGTVRLLPSLDLGDEGTLRRVRDRFGLRGGAVKDVRARVLADFGAALAVLAAGPATTGGTGATSTTAITTTTTAEPTGTTVTTVATPSDETTARTLISDMVDLGLIALDTSNAPTNGAFPGLTRVRYVLVASSVSGTDAVTVVLPLISSVARQVPAVLTVAEAGPIRPDGQATPTIEGQPARGDLVRTLREGTLSERVSTVDGVEESSGRIALVYAVAQQRDSGTVGHYGTGIGATAPFPTVPRG